MDASTREADRALERYRASRTVEGRFLSYCRGRSRRFWTRQYLILLFAPYFLHLAGWKMSVVMALLYFTADTLDSVILHRIGNRTAIGKRLPMAIGITTITAGIQALVLALLVTVVFTTGNGQTATLCGAIFLAGLLDAAVLYKAHRSAAILRILIYIAGIVSIIAVRLASTSNTDPTILSDSFAALLLTNVGWIVVSDIHRTKARRHATQLATLETARDLAHANAALESSRQTTKRLALVAKHANDSVIITDKDGTITWVNAAFTRTTGYSFAEAVGRNVTFLDGPSTDREASAALDRARGEQRSLRLEIVNQHKDGHPVWVEINMCPLFDENDDLVSIVSIERDISEAKQREMALADARRMAEKAVRARHNFLATMSHEIRTPMNGVIGMADLLLDTELDDQQRPLVTTINASGEALLAIVNDILDFSKLEAGRFDVAHTPFSPRACFESTTELMQPLADAKGLSLRLIAPSSLPDRVSGDGRRLQQVIVNLVGNAIKFTENGAVQLEVSVQLKGSVCKLMIAVRDTGIGIAPENHARIFDSFSQAGSDVAGRFGGTGLGLSISRLLVQAMGGTISVASKPNEGSAFFVSLDLPIAAEDADGAQVRPLAAPAQAIHEVLDGVKVLVAEDNRTNTLLLKHMLAGSGADPLFVENGREAVAHFRTSRPNVVLMDLHMPILDGLAATREIRQYEAESGLVPVPVIALTANAFPEDRDLCIAAGMDEIVTKPFRKRDLMNALARRFSAGDRPSERAVPAEATARSG